MKDKRCIWYLLMLTFLMVLISVTETRAMVTFSRPTQDGEPTQVFIDICILDVDEIDSANQSFTANIFFKTSWKDPRLAHKGKGKKRYPLNEVWHPEFQLVNQQRLWTTFSDYVEVDPDGTVMYRQRVWGQFSQKLGLKDFPFDQQVFTLRFVAAGYSVKEVEFVRAPERLSGIAETLSLADWEIVDWNVRPQEFVGTTGYFFTFTAERKSNYFIIKIILPLLLVVGMSWVVFWIDPIQSGAQINVAITTMLTLIAYRFAVGAELPKISYLTRMDVFILGSTLIVFSSLIEVVITSALAGQERLEQARRIDRWCRAYSSRLSCSFLLCIHSCSSDSDKDFL